MEFSNELAKLDCAVALERMGGDEELLREVARLFLDEYPGLIEEIRIAATANDTDALQRAAHSLKGSVSNFGAESVCNAAYVLENMGRKGDLSAVTSNIQSLIQALDYIRPALLELAAQ